MVAPFTGFLAVVCALILWRRFPNIPGRVAVLILMGLDFSQQLIARGGIIILAVALSQKRA